jgi:arylsulfatase A-like enzyme
MAPKKPNILIMWGDDIGIRNISHFSKGQMGEGTPNIDGVANEVSASPTTTASRPAPLDAPPSSPPRTRSALA